MKSIIVFLLSIVLVSCGKHRDGTSVWGGALWLLPVIGIIGTAIFLTIAYKSSKSNSTTQLPGTGGTLDNTGNVPIYKSGFFWFAVIIAIATIAVVIGVNANKG